MHPLISFRRRNFAFGNLGTLPIYGGLALAVVLPGDVPAGGRGLRAVEAGLTGAGDGPDVPPFQPFWALADRFGPRCSWDSAHRVGRDPDAGPDRCEPGYLTDLLPAMMVFGLGLSVTVAPLTATVLSDADESDSGLASG